MKEDDDMIERYAMLLTLGHNASAIAVHKDSGMPLGYEEERLTRKKSDSHFPINAIKEIGKHIPLEHVDTFYVSSWFNGFSLYTANKYWDFQAFHDLCPNATYCDTGLTHHDMHAMSSVAFTEQYISLSYHRWHIMVIDGFGTDEEVLSLYEHEHNEQNAPRLIYRERGYENSMGLLFQYAAEFQGMDGINDVYKYLGYRAHMKEERREHVIECARHFQKSHPPMRPIDGEELQVYPINLTRLKQVKHERYFQTFERYDLSREEMGYFLQLILEDKALGLVKQYDIQNLMAAGGCFFNVRLNGQLVKQLERLSVMPLAGDQGAAIGAFRFCMGPNSFNFTDLCWGPRPAAPSSVDPASRRPLTGFYRYDASAFASKVDEIVEKLNRGEIVNILRGSMEFGPRALCHTSTLAPPTAAHVDAINTLNGRSTVMPMAPVMTYGDAHRLFKKQDIGKVFGTDSFMVCAHAYAHGKGEEVAGAALKDGDEYTGRPQIVKEVGDPELYKLLSDVTYPCLINTSLNRHGEPIIFTYEELHTLHAEWLKLHTDDMPAFSTYCFL
jgi:carbamoyltransferase